MDIHRIMLDYGFEKWDNKTYFLQTNDINCMYSAELFRRNDLYRLSGYFSFTSIKFENEWTKRRKSSNKKSVMFPICQHVWNLRDDTVRNIFLDYVSEDDLHKKMFLIWQILSSNNFCFHDFNQVIQTKLLLGTHISSWIPDRSLYGPDAIIIQKFNEFLDWIEETVPSARYFLTPGMV